MIADGSHIFEPRSSDDVLQYDRGRGRLPSFIRWAHNPRKLADESWHNLQQKQLVWMAILRIARYASQDACAPCGDEAGDVDGFDWPKNGMRWPGTPGS